MIDVSWSTNHGVLSFLGSQFFLLYVFHEACEVVDGIVKVGR